MNDTLSKDEYDALAQIAQGQKTARPSACVARNTKRLSGLKYITQGKDGRLALSDKGQQTLFIKNCIDSLRTLKADPAAKIHGDVLQFLLKKGHIAALETGYQLTTRGQESLADIEAK